MIHRSRTISYAVVIFAAQIIACGDARRSVHVDSPLAFDHGVNVGDRLTPANLACDDNQSRKVAALGKTQLVTFWTIDDCSDCSRHLQGLETVWKRSEIPVEQFVVTYATPSRAAEVLRLHAVGSTRPLCMDTSARYWDKYDMRHTPVTMLLRSGRVAFMDDMPLDSDERRAEFVSRVIKASRQ